MELDDCGVMFMQEFIGRIHFSDSKCVTSFFIEHTRIIWAVQIWKL